MNYNEYDNICNIIDKNNDVGTAIVIVKEMGKNMRQKKKRSAKNP